MRIFALPNLPPDTCPIAFFERLANLPESWTWGPPEPVKILLCPVGRRLADQANWPLLRKIWWQCHRLSPLSQVYLEAKPCP